MCGGVIFTYKKGYKETLEQLYLPQEVEAFERAGEVRSVYWQKGEPVLPVVIGGENGDGSAEEIVMRWGNRDKKAPFPQTGWARVDSIESGRWDYLKPEPVLIPAIFGVEKGHWFVIENGIKGVLVHRGGEKRVYMLTDEAAPAFLDVTRHPRMPVLVSQHNFQWLEADPFGRG